MPTFTPTSYFRKIAFFALAISLVASACQNSSNSATAENTETAPAANEAPTAAETPAVDPTPLPSIPEATMQQLFEQCDYIDYVFYYTNFSISQNEQASIRATLAHVSPQPAPMNPNCKPMGRIFYQVQGENVAEADFYFSQDCLYYIFMENNKPKYGNYMSEQGFTFFKNIFAQIQQQQQQQAQ
ncbi:MAG: hypothetical protein AAF798_17515 [Bacteroidota bacterium]